MPSPMLWVMPTFTLLEDMPTLRTRDAEWRSQLSRWPEKKTQKRNKRQLAENGDSGKLLILWSQRRGSKPLPPVYETDALPTELRWLIPSKLIIGDEFKDINIVSPVPS